MTAVAPVPRQQKSLTIGMQSFTAQIRSWHERHGYDAWLTANALHNCGRGRIQMRLASLLLRGYVERERILGTTGGPQFLYRYRLTALGITALKAINSQSSDLERLRAEKSRERPQHIRKIDLMAALVSSLAGKDVGSGGDLSSVRSLSGSEVTVPQSRRPIGPTGREDSPRVAPPVNWCIPDCATCDGGLS